MDDKTLSGNASALEPLDPRNVRPIAIAATFTADPVLEPLRFWLQTLHIDAPVCAAPYAQIMQQLLHPKSLLATNQTGFNILLLRFEDWIRDRAEHAINDNLKHVCRARDELLAGVRALRGKSSAEIFIFICPLSSTLAEPYRKPLLRMQGELAAGLGALKRVYCLSHAELARLYPVSRYEDERSEHIGHVPYTAEYFVALATLLARRIAALVQPRRKVIALDCDNTLWRGICGEDGPNGVVLTPAHLRFQQLLVEQHDAGTLLCLCSKNNAADVDAVFANRPDMPLRPHHLIYSRVNWSAKSANLSSLGEELDLSLDSFIFVDDSPVECAEIEAQCPSVLTLCFPQKEAEIVHFIDHVWAFDRSGTTEEGRLRTEQYRQNRARKEASEQMTDFAQFLSSLDLSVTVTAFDAQHLPRVSELVQRTNQFNLTTVRRSAAEIESLWTSLDLEIFVVHVRDRFGDYGLVGAVLFRRTAAAIELDTFVLSCRVLGRGVEHRVVNELGRLARQAGCATVTLRYRQTPRNAPAWTFLQESFGRFCVEASAGEGSAAEHTFVVPADEAERITVVAVPSSQATNGTVSALSAPTDDSEARALHDVALKLSDVGAVMRAMRYAKRRTRQLDSEYVEARTPTEVALALIWSEILCLDDVGVFDDFFQLGGDSLLAVQAVSRIGVRLKVDVPLDVFFAGATPAGIARELASARPIQEPIERVRAIDAVPLSSAQRRLWFIDQLEGGSAAYHIPLALRLEGPLNHEALHAALDALLERHEALRTAFVVADGEPMQRVLASAGLALQYADLRTHEPEQRQAEASRIMCEEAAARFDLSAGMPIRSRMLQLSDSEHLLLITMHHIVSDGWSVGVLIQELGTLYEARHLCQPDSLSELPIQYSDYARWQRQSMRTARAQQQVDYWRAHLQGAPELLELPTDRARPPVQSYRGASVPVSLASELTAEVRAFSRQQQLTLAMTLYAAWVILLGRLSGREDMVVGLPVANRRRQELEGLIGFFVNTLPIRVAPRSEQIVADLLREVKQTLLQAYAHQDAPFEQVVEALQPQRSLSYGPIVQVMFVLQPAPAGTWQPGTLTLKQEEVPTPFAQFDLNLSLQEFPDGIRGAVSYATDLFDRETIEGWVACFSSVLRSIVREPEAHVGSVALLDPAQQERIVQTFNDTHTIYPRERLIHELFEEQVERTPHATAALDEDRTLTYSQLNDQANRLALDLHRQGVRIGEYVPVYMQRSLRSLVAQIAVLKCGAVYVPIDPELPGERRSFMIRDCDARTVLADRAAPPYGDDAAQWIDCTSLRDVHESGPVANLSLRMDAHRTAYVMYTSGSTGVPKGVMVSHDGVNRLVFNNGYARIEPDDSIAHHSNPAFDASTFEVWGALLRGARVLVVPQAVLIDVELFAATLARNAVTILYLSVGLFNQYAEALGCVFKRLKYALVGGDVLDPQTIRHVLKTSPPRRLLNVYGPTECTTFSTTYVIDSVADGAKSIPIGRPMSNAQIYILDARRQVVPIGAIGEMYIGGAGVAIGYLNRPELTAERFLPDPFSGEPGARVYRTGDLARWRADGTIEFIGRNDQQVKIRGFRIELGEIEAQLLKHEQVRHAVVIAREGVGQGKSLVAYVTPREPAAFDLAQVRAYLRGRLPEYMVPAAMVMMDMLPLTATGKIDRRALPAPQLQAYVSRQYERPQGELEGILASIWQELLAVERVGRLDNFFELGGHSLLVVQLLERLRRAGLSAEVRRIFESPTLADLAATLHAGAAEPAELPPNLIAPGCTAITPEMVPMVRLEPPHIQWIVQSVPGGVSNIQDIYPLAPLQEGILFHHLLSEGGGDIYVLPTVLSVSSRQRLEQLSESLQRVVDRHDALRTAILWEQLPMPVQVVWRQARVQVDELTFDPAREPEEQIKDWLRPDRLRLNLRCAPLLRLQAAQSRDGRCYVLLQLHHIIADGQSLHTVISEVMSHLSGKADSLAPALPYRDHVAQAIAYSRKHDANAFFRSKLADIDEPTAPFGLLDVHDRAGRTEEASEVLDSDLAGRIRAQGRRMGMSSASLFHAAWGLVVAATSGREDVVFGSVLLGRLQAKTDTQRVLGMFMNTLPLRLRLRNTTAQELVEQAQRELVELLGHEQASLAAAQRCSGIAGANPLFTTLLNYRHTTRKLNAKWSEVAGVGVVASRGFTNYPLTVSVDDRGEGFEVTAQTDRTVDPRRIAAYLLTALESLVHALEGAPQTAALALPILPPRELREVLEAFNAKLIEYPRQKLIHELFEEQVRLTPEAVAVQYQDESVTYAGLNAKANLLARYLRSKAVGPDALVAICMERSPTMVVGVLAALKAGAAYVPLDPNYPTERLQYMLEDAAPQVVLTQSSLRDVLPATRAEPIDLDTLLRELEGEGDARNLTAAEPGLTAQNLLYVIYTSGSTGRPKGTEMSHGAMVNLIEWHRCVFGAGDQVRVLQFAALSFDVSFQEIFTTLCTGGALVLLDEWVRRDAKALLELLNRQCVERLFVPPLLLQSLAEYSQVAGVVPRTLRDVITAGEQLRISREIVELFECLPDSRLHNHYGPTETHVVTALTLSGDPRHWPNTPTIGAPIANTQIYVLDRERRPVPLGVIGEIYIGGANLARGYLHRPELTAERFVPDPFSSKSIARMYKTGDLGRWRADGTIEYLGRNDDQVKIRGFRIELGEVETLLALHPDVRDAAVIAREDVPGEKRLVAYVTPRAEHIPDAAELRAHVKATLPEHMVPTAFLVLQSLPLSPNGKLNRRALPRPEPEADTSRHYLAPQGEQEQTLAAIWRQLLHVEQVGRADNFFDLGGHSLLAMQVSARVHGAFHVELPVRVLFEYPTLQELAEQIERLRAVPEIDSGKLQELLDTVSELPDSRVQELLRDLSTEHRV